MSLRHSITQSRQTAQCLFASARSALALRQPQFLKQQAIRSKSDANINQRAKAKAETKKKKKKSTSYPTPDLSNVVQYPLLDAMRYIRAAEVGRSPTSSKYELHVKLKTQKDGAVVRNRIRLPHPVSTDRRMAVICKPDSPQAAAAVRAGAVLVGEDNIFDAVRQGRIEFDRCICHQDSFAKLNKAQLARILGPKGLMPSVKFGTVVKDVFTSVQEITGAAQYRERMGVIQMAVGQLVHTPEQLQSNITAFISSIKKDCAALSEVISKEIHEVVLSSTNGPGLSLSGLFKDNNSIPAKDLAA